MTSMLSSIRGRGTAVLLGMTIFGALLLRSEPGVAQGARGAAARHPNFVIIMADDMGYADLHINGNPVIETPNIDRMAHEGLQLTSLYATPLCTPTRGEVLTSRYPVRTGLVNVTGPGSPQGIRAEEVTIAEALKEQGYRTAMYGKWHIGDFDTNPAWNPTAHGFDEFLGLPYSHDYNPPTGVPLYHNLEKVEQPVKYNLLTQRYTEGAVKFIRSSAGRPFFVYLAHNLPHIPIGTSDQFRGHSRAGRYGDVIEEIDWSVGQVLGAIKAIGADQNTVVVFQSDNGPWVSVLEQTYDRSDRGQKIPGDVGWPGLLRGSKGTTYDGGTRVPGIVRWPGTIRAGRVSADMVSVMDWLPTFVALAGGRVTHQVDGVNQSAFLRGTGPDARTELFEFSAGTIQVVRQGSWKLRIGPPENAGRRGRGNTPDAAAAAGRATVGAADAAVPQGNRGAAAQPPAAPVVELFNLDTDPAERLNVASAHPDIVERLRTRIQDMQAEVNASAPRPSAAAARFVETVSWID